MWKNIFEAAKGVARSKRFFAALIAGIVWVVGRIGLDVDTEALAGAVSPLWLFIVGQSVSDIGKGREEAKGAIKEKEVAKRLATNAE